MRRDSHNSSYASSKMAPSFFDDYPNFSQNPRAPITREFHRLACSMAWRGRVYKSLRAECYSQELVQHWGAIMSDDEDDDEGSRGELSRLECWQMLCEELGMEDIPCSISRCQKEARRIHVNIIDLIDARRAGSRVQTFPTANQMMRYTRQTGRFVPADMVKRDRFVTALLKHLF